MTARTLRVAQIGVSNHGETITKAILASKTLRLASVYDVVPEDVKRVAAMTSSAPAGSFEEVLADGAIDAVALVTPNHLHAIQVEGALEAGKHVFVEKPIAKTVAEAKRIVLKAGERGRVLMVGHNTRRRPVFRHAKKILDNLRLGTLVGIEANMSRPVGIMEGLPRWKSDRSSAGLISMTQLGIHFVDVIHYLAGPVVRAGCIGMNTAMPGGNLDAVSAVLELASGIPAALSAYYVTPDAYSFRVYGTQGILDCHSGGYVLKTLNGTALRDDAAEEFPNEGFASYEEEMEEFGRCILHGGRPETAGEEGLLAMAVIEAMTRSIETRRIVDIKEVLES